MASVNKVIILGNVGRDPESRQMPSGDSICNLSMATTRKWKDKEGEKHEETEWHRVTFFGRQAEIVEEYVQKGDPLYIEGRIKTRKYTDKEGFEKYATEIIATELQLLGSKRDREDRAPAPAPRAPENPVRRAVHRPRRRARGFQIWTTSTMTYLLIRTVV
jgi:single-strand DNA-binding protein